MKYLLAIAAGAATLAIAPAVAQTVRPAPAAPTHTRAQVADHVRAMFARLDANRDGYLTKEEAQAGRGAHRAQRLARDPAQKAQR